MFYYYIFRSLFRVIYDIDYHIDNTFFLVFS